MEIVVVMINLTEGNQHKEVQEREISTKKPRKGKSGQRSTGKGKP